jgi:hypothetical protein
LVQFVFSFSTALYYFYAIVEPGFDKSIHLHAFPMGNDYILSTDSSVHSGYGDKRNTGLTKTLKNPAWLSVIVPKHLMLPSVIVVINMTANAGKLWSHDDNNIRFRTDCRGKARLAK